MQNLLFILVWCYKKVDKIVLVQEKITKFEFVYDAPANLSFVLSINMFFFFRIYHEERKSLRAALKLIFSLVLFNLSFQHL